MAILGNGKINPRPCSETEEARNWQVLSTIINNVFEIIEGGAVDNFTVKASDADPAPDTLIDKLYYQDTFAAETHQEVFAEIVDDGGTIKVRLFTAIGEGGGGGGPDGDELVKVSSNDTTAGYLIQKWKDTNGIDSGADILVSAQITEPGANEHLQAFLDVSTIPAYANTGTLLLGLVNNVSTYLTLATVGAAVPDKYRLIRGRAVGSVTSGDATFLVDNVEALAGGLDPSSGNTATQVRVANLHEDNYDDDEWVIAAYNELVVGSPETHWEALPKVEDGADGASGTYVCNIASPISAGSAASMTSGTATVYSIGEDGATTSLGIRTVYNPFAHSIAGDCSCAKTFAAEDSDNDQFTITGFDLLEALALLTGFAANTALYTDGASATDIQWGGEECEE